MMSRTDRGRTLKRALSRSVVWLLPCAAASVVALAVLSTAVLGELGYVACAAIMLGVVAAVVWNVERVVWALLLLDIPFGIDVNLFYREAEGSFGAIGGLNISLTSVYITLLYFLWLLQMLARRAPPPRLYLRLTAPLLLYLAFLGLSLINALDRQLGLFDIGLLLQMLLVLLYFANRIRARADVIFVLVCLALGMGLQSLIVLVVAATGISFSVAGISTSVSETLDYGSRAVGTFGTPNGLAGYLLLMLGASSSLLFMPIKRRYKFIVSACIVMGLASLLLTQSRGAWLGFGLAALIYYLALWRRGYLPRPLNIALLSGVLVVALAVQPLLVSRFSAEDTSTANGRLPLNALALRLVQDNPVFGVGTNNYIVAVQGYLTPEYTDTWIYTVHNKFLQIWSEAGPLALLAYIGFLIVSVLSAWRVWRLQKPVLSIAALSVAATFSGHALHMQFDIFTGRVYVQSLWMLAALVIALRFNFEAPVSQEPAITYRGRRV